MRLICESRHRPKPFGLEIAREARISWLKICAALASVSLEENIGCVRNVVSLSHVICEEGAIRVSPSRAEVDLAALSNGSWLFRLAGLRWPARLHSSSYFSAFP